MLRLLKRQYPDANCALVFKNPLQLLVATILSAQCTDETVNRVTPALFERYKIAPAFANASLSELEKLIHSTGFYRNKAKNIKAASCMIVEKFGGRVPATMEELLELPGVARKTANVVLFNGFGIQVGITVDTHVSRLAGRLGLSRHHQPVKIEQDLMKITPKKDFGMLAHYLIWHGRKICKARKPLCAECVLQRVCPSAFLFE